MYAWSIPVFKNIALHLCLSPIINTDALIALKQKQNMSKTSAAIFLVTLVGVVAAHTEHSWKSQCYHNTQSILFHKINIKNKGRKSLITTPQKYWNYLWKMYCPRPISSQPPGGDQHTSRSVLGRLEFYLYFILYVCVYRKGLDELLMNRAEAIWKQQRKVGGRTRPLINTNLLTEMWSCTWCLNHTVVWFRVA